MPERRATIDRRTAETQIRLSLNLDGTGRAEVRTGVPFLDHMLTLTARHGLLDLEIEASGDLHGRWIATFDAELVHEFFQAVAFNARINLHFLQHRGGNAHHVAEAAFKAFGRALDAATRRDARVEGVPSTKGVL